jgi:hypothetical protein
MSKFQTIEKALRESWDKKTCFPPVRDQWKQDLPELGQCAVTSLIIQEIYGGEIFFNKKINHFWNKLPTGEFIDLTRSQFKRPIKIKRFEQVDRDTILKSSEAKRFKTANRYKLLKRRFLQILLDQSVRHQFLLLKK